MPFNVTLHTLISSPRLYESLNKHDISHPFIDETLYNNHTIIYIMYKMYIDKLQAKN